MKKLLIFCALACLFTISLKANGKKTVLSEQPKLTKQDFSKIEYYFDENIILNILKPENSTEVQNISLKDGGFTIMYSDDYFDDNDSDVSIKIVSDIIFDETSFNHWLENSSFKLYINTALYRYTELFLDVDESKKKNMLKLYSTPFSFFSMGYSKEFELLIKNNIEINQQNSAKISSKNGIASPVGNNGLIPVVLYNKKINLWQSLIFYGNGTIVWDYEDANYYYGKQKIGFMFPEIIFAFNKELLKYTPNADGFYLYVKTRLKKSDIQKSKKVNHLSAATMLEKKSGTTTTVTYFPVKKNYTVLNRTGTNFSVNFQRVRSNTTQEVCNVIDRMPFYNHKAAAMLIDDKKVDIKSYGGMKVWAALYLNTAKLKEKIIVDKKSTTHALALIYATKYKKAQEVLLAILKQDSENYGANILLGLLAIWNKENFKYLEKAFEINPLKTILFVKWQSHGTRIYVSENKQWDFFDAFIHMLIANKNVDYKKLPQLLKQHLIRAIYEKYYDENKKIIPKYKAMENNLQGFFI